MLGSVAPEARREEHPMKASNLFLKRPSVNRRGPGTGRRDFLADGAPADRECPPGEHPEERRRANRIVRELAVVLDIPFGAEVLEADLLVYARYRDWRIDVYLELETGDVAEPMGPWVLILSRDEERACRTFPGPGVVEAAEHIRSFVADAQYRRRWLADTGGSRAPNRKILVVEDKGETANALRMLLEMVGYEVRVASTGPEGLEQATCWLPDAVLCDIGLPGLDGCSVAGRLRRNPATAGICLVAVTGCRTETERIHRAGFDHYFTKPADPLALLQVLPRPAPGKGIG
jgi:CheY-like chemotaxis protein